MKQVSPFNLTTGLLKSKTGLLLGLGTAVLFLFSGCAVTPHANIGMDLNYYNGGFHVQPSAHVGLSGRPRR